jgi:hypothetical protein
MADERCNATTERVLCGNDKPCAKHPDRVVEFTPEDVRTAHASVIDEFMEWRPKRTFLSLEDGPREGCPEVLGVAVVGTPDSHEGWRGPTVVIAQAYLDDPGEAGHMVIGGRHSLEQLRAAIDYALGDRRSGS